MSQSALRHRPPNTFPSPSSLLDTLTHDPDPSSESHGLLHTLEDFQSRIHYGPDDKPLGSDEGEDKDKGEDKPRDAKALLLAFEELPAWRHDDEFVRSGHRRCELLAHDVLFNLVMMQDASNAEVAYAVGSVMLGCGLMALLGRWA